MKVIIYLDKLLVAISYASIALTISAVGEGATGFGPSSSEINHFCTMRVKQYFLPKNSKRT